MANLLEVFVESGPAGQIMSANVIGQQCSITLALLLYRLGSLSSVETFREKPECQSHCDGRDKIHMPTESINEHTTSNAVSSKHTCSYYRHNCHSSTNRSSGSNASNCSNSSNVITAT